MDKLIHNQKLGWIGGLILLLIIARFGWLYRSGDLVFESDIRALLPVAQDSWLIQLIDSRVTVETDHRIAVIIQGRNQLQTDAATDRFVDLLEQAMARQEIAAELIDGVEYDVFEARIKAMLAYKDRLIGDRSRRDLLDSVESVLNRRIEQVTQFPPSNLTDPVADPLATLEQFLAERMPKLDAVQSDGLYLRLNADTPANLLPLELFAGKLGNQQANQSVRSILAIRDIVSGEFTVKIYLSGVPLHVATIKQQTSEEVRWMVSLAALLSLGFFLYITRSIRALLATAVSTILAIAGGLVISQGTIGLPHLIGLTMATTAIGICIDFSLHFWVHVRTGMSGTAAISSIRAGINMSLLTTLIGLLMITFTSIPVLARSAIFICGALLISWIIVLFIFPWTTGKTDTVRAGRIAWLALPKKTMVVLMLVIVCVSVTGLMTKYYTDDDPIRLGHQSEDLQRDDRIVRRMLGYTSETGIYLVQADSASTLLETEAEMLHSLSENELSQVSAVSRLVVPEARQRRNQAIFQQSRQGIDAKLLQQYLSTMQVPTLSWKSGAEGPYTLPWVLTQPWAKIERNYILSCNQELCASMVRARGDAVSKLDASCRQNTRCQAISLSERTISAFKNLRINLAWALMLASGAMLVVLYLRYRSKAFKLMLVPILASLSGIAAVAWAGMPVTTFTLAAVFPLLGLSVDYVIFANEHDQNSAPTSLAIFASAFTTTLSFLILAFSTTPAVRFFALPVAVGIPVAWILVQAMQANGREKISSNH